MKLVHMKFYDGAKEKIGRLGLSHLFLELLSILFAIRVELLEEKDANGAAEIRKRIDDGFAASGGWEQIKTGGIDWQKRFKFNATIAVSMGVEIQVSARSDLLIRDVVHLRNSIQSGAIDLGVIVVPSDKMQHFLPDRTPSYRDAIRYIEEEFVEAQNFPIVIIAVEHDSSSAEALPKQKRRS